MPLTGLLTNCYKFASINESEIEDYGVISIMYHRFDESKYPSTNIQVDVFKKQLEIIQNEKIIFIQPSELKEQLSSNKNQRKILLTIDDGLLSFYNNAWPILKSKKIPFIIFVNTREVGSYNYMNWAQIKELASEDFVEIGNHSHSHEYLVDEKSSVIRADIETSIKIFKDKLGKNSKFFSYPFGEYSLNFRSIIEEFGFEYAFGQHSGVIDETKNFYELPRFPINEKYGKIDRFKTLVKTLPFKFKKISPEEKYLTKKENPPKVQIEFYDNIKYLDRINCFSNEGDIWRSSKINFVNDNILDIDISEKFVSERGRINCSLNAGNGWFGIQFVIADK